ncbi:ribonuclease P protein component [Desertihabitans brevis]|uniref:Ribonuclease P protein component n=1 Tax=Desertihabitans brevis TaxID=2268447 RepID=A0A367YX04_9ACTN|nr:ribonuclease P protein component [Desertihabitans brevis]RCK70360.1 ribonuclease P protein component [Desertihabitans brevis]
MLPATHRMRSSREFAETIRSGVRVGGPRIVMHARTGEAGDGARVGFVVSRAVGGAVTRNRVKRRLRHLVAQHLDELGDLRLVVRALPRSAAEPDGLAEDVQTGLSRVHRRLAGAR